MTKDEMLWIADAVSLGCLPCRMSGLGPTPAEYHHKRQGQGAGRRASHYDGFPACPAHHRGTQHPAVPSIHLDKLMFVGMFGTEAELVEQTRREVAELRANTIGGAA